MCSANMVQLSPRLADKPSGSLKDLGRTMADILDTGLTADSRPTVRYKANS